MNGVAHCLLRVAEHLVLRGHQPVVAAPAPARDAPGEGGSYPCPVVRLPSLPMPGYPGRCTDLLPYLLAMAVREYFRAPGPAGRAAGAARPARPGSRWHGP